MHSASRAAQASARAAAAALDGSRRIVRGRRAAGGMAALAPRWGVGAAPDAEGVSPLLVGLLDGLLARYWERSPTAAAAMAFLERRQDAPILFDHFAFRSFGVDGCGIEALAKPLLDLGYSRRDRLDFKAKKLTAVWFSAPIPELPRVFVSELRVDELSPQAQDVVRRYTRIAAPAASGGHMMLSGVVGTLPWPRPLRSDFDLLAAESEYAAWTLVNGCALNHTTVSVHNLSGSLASIDALTGALADEGFALNASGGIVKRSPDGLLLQASTVADRVPHAFPPPRDAGTTEAASELVPGAYIEFAERAVLPSFAHLAATDVRECHRRDGFEAGNADKIFESTTLAS